MGSIAVAYGATASFAPGYGKFPLSFEPNVGQAESSILYVARGSGYSLGLSPNGATITTRADARGRASTVTMRFAGGTLRNHQAAEPLAAKVNYLVGPSSRWRTNVSTFRRVNYRNVYDGIGVSFYGNQGRLEYDFVVTPGADPARIRLAFDGARPTLTREGDLLLSGGLRQQKPYAYQLAADGSKIEVAARFAIDGARGVRFVLGNYDRARPLVIDPVLVYATYLGGSGNEGIRGLKVDAAGNAYITGFTTSAAFPLTTPGALQSANRGQGALEMANFGDAFVAKINAAGDGFVYATYLGGSGDEVGTALAVDSAGNVYVTGSTTSADFPATSGAYQRTFRGKGTFVAYSTGDAFVAKLNPSGTGLVYCTYLGGTLDEGATAIAVDAEGNATIAGNTESTNFPVTSGAIQSQYRGANSASVVWGGDAFVARLNPSGSGLVFSTYLGGRNDDIATSVAVDAAGNTHTAGITYSPDFPTSAGVLQSTFKGVETADFNQAAGDAFVAKLAATGALTYSTFLGGTGRDGAHALAVDSAGNAYVCGMTSSTDFPVTSGVAQAAYRGTGTGTPSGLFFRGDAYVAKLNPTASALVFATYLGGSGDDLAAAIAVEPNGNIVVGGFTLSQNFPVSSDALQSTFGGAGGQEFVQMGDAFVTRLNPTAASILFSTYYGGRGDDGAGALAVDANGNAYVGGITLSNDLKTAGKPVQVSFSGSGPRFPRGDAFVGKINFAGVTPGPAASVSFIAGTPQSGTAGAQVSLTVEVVDAQRNPLSGVTVTFSATNATVTPASASTGSNGRASTTATLGSAGTASIAAAVSGVPTATATIAIVPGATLPTITGAVNGASFRPSLSPGSWMTLTGSNFAASVGQATSTPLPTILNGVRVRVNNLQAPVYYVSSTQINVQLPYEIPAGQATAVVEVNGASSAPASFTVVPAAPGIFAYGDNRAVVQNVDAQGGVTLNTSDNPIKAGGVIIAYLTGQGPLDNPVTTGAVASGALASATSPYTVTIGGKQAQAVFLGMTPGFIALAQANIVVPADLATSDYPIVVTVGGVASNGPVISVAAN